MENRGERKEQRTKERAGDKVKEQGTRMKSR